MPRKHFWLCVPPVVACLFDNALTLWHQPVEYWAGKYAAAFEAAPHGRWLLTRHPLAFEGAVLAFILFFCFMILYLPRALAMIVSTAILLGHLTGASTWIAYERPLDGYWINLAVCVCAAVLVVASYQMTQSPPQLPEADPPAAAGSSQSEALPPYRDPFSSN